MAIDRNDLLHVETSALVVVVAAAFLPLWIACVIALVLGVGKELWDKEHGGVASWKDIDDDAVGVLIGTLITLLYI